MTKAVFRAFEAGGRSIDEPTEDELHDLLADMNLSHPYVIFERRDREPVNEHYIQVYLNDDLSYQVEYREGGSDRHFEAHVPRQPSIVGPGPVAKVMYDWAHDRDGWREALPWTLKSF
ncbi:hypothetical protein HUT18_00315 [Streptomyces sp. NA04227]|uniref:hypothetical protein n=1 Tax=Streptomyces sp. NA04227 TaxID=2742136 RepID=UPI001591DD8F|nr:hypothetical protein [Streptomyces sp. NA04227]QKW05026.1 hypothetical protein HUT18_00315 [Streptomyces sp. NA04227]